MVIEVENLVKKFGDFTAVDNISFEVKEGEIFGFLGANGAGKTTAIKMLCGLMAPTSGRGVVAGFDIKTQREKVKRRIGYMSQKFSLYDDLSSYENIMFYGGIYGIRRKELKKKAERLIRKLGLESVENKLLKSLPPGWKQKLAFSVALLHEPSVIFLDEPTGGVDPVTRRQFWELIYETATEGKTIFVTTHYMDEAEYCDRVSIMVNGRIDAMASPAELKQNFEVTSMEDVFLKLARS
ncbi:MAG TPA: ABC transporter ATP-binding protein [Cyclobacteriaceae bacterium]|jgi:ABC-2 type transport system ATP-binding protein